MTFTGVARFLVRDFNVLFRVFQCESRATAVPGWESLAMASSGLEWDEKQAAVRGSQMPPSPPSTRRNEIEAVCKNQALR